MPNNTPFVSIVVLNYFGEKVLKDTLDSLLSQNYPKNKFEIIIIDNGSRDKSKTLILEYAKNSSQISYRFLKQNVGFSKGNNEGVKIAKGEYVALLNNDTVVDKNWLGELIKEALKNDDIFAVNSRVMLYPRFFKLTIAKPFYSELDHVNLTSSSLLRFSKKNKIPVFFRAVEDEIECHIPFDPKFERKIALEFEFKKKKLKSAYSHNVLQILNFSKSTFNIKKQKESQNKVVYSVPFDTQSVNLKNHSFEKIQNAGIIVFQDGYGRDIGAKVRYMTQDYESYLDQYNHSTEIYAACAAAVLYKKDALEKLGLLNESFFMYYEDVDISERARFHGYKIMYSPNAIVRHLHALSSGEWSPFFIYHAEKGRLLHIFFNFPLSIFVNEYIKFFFQSVIRFVSKIHNPHSYASNVQYIFVSLDMILQIPYMVNKRGKFLNSINRNEIAKQYLRITEGYWYTH